ncbi:winged helix-turn-helix transcriptional regulator [Snodgrassella alvi]|uniref:winged helix-turn-helix transcriptional regulator n=1 Tax=Snodgrassella TaxID=1193515 RepID=UPI000A057779|nr:MULTISPECIES: helix-turn-helix domain-containing protein [Snodgrassella]MBI0130079.1 helix-turn-helix transcriptional regulator [Snodgrassella sp. W8124]NUE79967.1 helix-turn-helix transcriptional regulator [Snodgrassella sp. ESL0304]NUF79205.1 helix-turn-helix transcriptional regulator [Snodgrassella sp. ESL0323]ORF01090.1 transcriptional regulator [Snodgrassella alvi]ORF09874.1 transcriptional regulator [Snodgrassella alvi]
MENHHCAEDHFEDSGFNYTLSMIRGKYKIVILYWLNENQPSMRFNELKRSINHISFKTLSNTLKEMEKDKLIFRKEYPQIPPKVEYGLLERGKSLVPILDMLCQWGNNHKNDPLS